MTRTKAPTSSNRGRGFRAGDPQALVRLLQVELDTIVFCGDGLTLAFLAPVIDRTRRGVEPTRAVSRRKAASGFPSRSARRSITRISSSLMRTLTTEFRRRFSDLPSDFSAAGTCDSFVPEDSCDLGLAIFTS